MNFLNFSNRGKRRHSWYWCLIVIAAGGSLVCSESAVAASETEGTAAVQKESMLLLQGGGMVRGRINGTPDGYIINQTNGNLFVPLEQVRFQCSDLHEAYSKQLETTVDKTAAGHIALARWCVTYKLLTEARDELRTALALEPGRDETRVLLRRVEDLLNPYKAPPPAPEPARKRFTEADMQSRPSESLGGLSREAALQFSRRIAPILMNNCSTTACHGPSARNEFRLSIIRSPQGSQRHLVENNLTTVLKYVDLDEPLESPLLTIPSRNHGPRGTAIFSGLRGEEQARELREWVQSLARHKAETGLKPAMKAVATAPAVPPVPPAVSPQKAPRAAAPELPGHTPPTESVPGPRLPEKPGTALAGGEQANQADEEDLFDPKVFNRQKPKRSIRP